MQGTTETMLAYYLGLGFVIFLGWATVVPDRQLDETTARRYLRWTTIAAIIGLLHPAIALAARDIVGQVGIELPNNSNDDLPHRQARATTAVNALAILSAVPIAALLVISSL